MFNADTYNIKETCEEDEISYGNEFDEREIFIEDLLESKNTRALESTTPILEYLLCLTICLLFLFAVKLLFLPAKPPNRFRQK